MKIALSGSMIFAKEFMSIGKRLEKAGHIVIIPANSEKFASGEIDIKKKWQGDGEEALKEYFYEIKRSDALLVINKEKKGTKGYVGASALIEMAFAQILGKKIFLWNEIPKMSYTDEIKSMKPIIINENISFIR